MVSAAHLAHEALTLAVVHADELWRRGILARQQTQQVGQVEEGVIIREDVPQRVGECALQDKEGLHKVNGSGAAPWR